VIGVWCETAGAIDIPETVRRKARAAGVEDWIERLPGLVSSLEDDWAIVVGRPYVGGSEAFVADATQADGSPAILEVLVPGAGNDAFNEATVLRIVGGKDVRRCTGMTPTGGSAHGATGAAVVRAWPAALASP
jgi:hypothetical protein